MEINYEMNAKLQKKKNALRRELAEKGILKRGGQNDYDHYKYFSEAQYKELFTGLFAKHGLELNFSELDYITFEAPGKQSNGRIVKLEFQLIDTDTGYSEVSVVSGEGHDKGDKGGYKAYTGAVKYFLANKFMVATGDDPEKESPAETMVRFITPEQIATIEDYYGDRLPEMLKKWNLPAIESMKEADAGKLIARIRKAVES